MINFLEVLVTIVSLILIGVVVAQKSKTQGMGAGFGGGAEDLFGSRARGMDALLPFRHLDPCLGTIDAYILNNGTCGTYRRFFVARNSRRT